MVCHSFLGNTRATIGTVGKWDNLKRINNFENKIEHRVEKNILLRGCQVQLFYVRDAVLICMNRQKNTSKDETDF